MVGTISVPAKILNTLFEDYEATVPGEYGDYEAVPESATHCPSRGHDVIGSCH